MRARHIIFFHWWLNFLHFNKVQSCSKKKTKNKKTVHSLRTERIKRECEKGPKSWSFEKNAKNRLLKNLWGKIERMNSFKYLGARIQANGKNYFRNKQTSNSKSKVYTKSQISGRRTTVQTTKVESLKLPYFPRQCTVVKQSVSMVNQSMVLPRLRRREIALHTGLSLATDRHSFALSHVYSIINNADAEKISAFEIKSYRKRLRIPLTKNT